MSERPQILIVYATSHGHTARIAARLAQAMSIEGAKVKVHEAGTDPDPEPFDLIVVAGSLRAERQPELVSWVEANRDLLAARQGVFLSKETYREYGRVARALMRWNMKPGRQSADSRRDYEHTDWQAIDRLGRELVRARAPVGAFSSGAATERHAIH